MDGGIESALELDDRTLSFSAPYRNIRNAIENEGYIENDRRHGARVSPAVRLDGEFREKLEGELALLIAESGLKGMEKQDFLTLCGQIFDQMSGLHPTAQGVCRWSLP